MSTLLKDLTYPDAVLLMYLANELPADDRATIDQRVENDSALQDKLDELRLAYGAVDAFIGAADVSVHVPSAFGAARLLGDVVRERQRNRKTEDHEVHERRRGWWMIYPASAAALLCIGMMAWYRVAQDQMSKVAAPADPMVFNRGANDWHGDREWRMFNRPPQEMGTDLAKMDDSSLEALFDPIVNDNSDRSMNHELSALQLMDSGLD